jgi:hypothetical protein
MNLKNISRDGFWLKDLTSFITWTTTNGNVATDGTVYSDIASAFANTTSGASGSFGVGVLMEPCKEDHVPFRVKAYVPTNDNVYLLVGYAPSSPTGDDTPATLKLFHLIGEFDDILMLPPQDGGSYEDRAIMFAIWTGNVAIHNVALSVQKLDVTPPQMSIAVP